MILNYWSLTIKWHEKVIVDFIVIDKDIMNCNEYEIPYIKVLKTYSDGKQVY